MREKLALTIALGTAAVALALGGGGLAGAQGPVTVGPGGASVNVPGGPSVTVPTTACSDGVDNDGDGAVDLADPDCASSAGTSEGTGPVEVPIPTTPPPAPAPPPAPGGGTQPGGGSGGGGGTGVGGNVPPGSGNGVTPHETINGITGGGKNGNGPGGVNGPGGNGPGKPLKPPPPYTANGPTVSNPTTTVGVFGPAPIGVPNFVIDSFEIPPFLLPLYQACGTEYGIPWPVLASINKIETAFGTNLNVSSAGAEGWMQFIPSPWAAYGVDANGDGREDPYNPVDAICAAARYLRAAGGQHDLYNAILAYNHADWYVQEVLLYARSYGKLPDDLVTSLTGLTEGAHFPVAADARYADDISTRAALRDSKPTARKTYGNAAEVVTSSPTRRGINIFSRRGAAIVAVNDGVIKAMGETKKLGKYVVLQDAYGNRFTYAELGHIIRVHPVPKPTKLTAADFKLVSPPGDKKPTAPASDSSTAITAGDAASAARRTEGDGRTHGAPAKKASTPAIHVHVDRTASHRHRLTNTEDMRPRLYALPDRPANRDRASLSGQINDLAGKHLPGYVTFRNYFNDVFGANSKNTELRPLRVGSKVIGGTVIGRMAAPVDGVAPHINFAIRPAGRGAPSIDPKPILDGWKLLEATAIYRASGKNPFASNLGVGQVLLMSKSALMRRVLSDPRLSIYSCGRNDIATGQIDRRVLAVMEYLVEKGFRLTITSLKCGHSILTTSGNVSNHSSGNAVDIAVINGIPVTGHQGPGSITDALLKTVLQLQGAMVPDELISLESLGGPSFALPDHYDHVHIGYTPLYGTGATDQKFVQLLKPDQWQRLIKRLGEIPNPTVPVHPSDASVPTKGAKKGKGGKGSGGAAAERASGAHIGE